MLGLSRLYRVIAFLMVFLLMALSAAPPIKAAALPRFSISATSGPAGLLIHASQIDPCPDQLPFPAPAQYVELTFTDAAGIKDRAMGASVVADTGDWFGSPELFIPWRVVASYDTSQVWPAAALGTGSLALRCFSGSQTTQTYQSQAFTVTGPAPSVKLSATKVQFEQTVRVDSAYACPFSAPVGRVTIGNSNAAVSQGMVFDSGSGVWHANVKIPKVVTDAMGASKELSLGNVVVSATCFGGQGGTLHYGNTLLEIVAPPAPAVKMVALGDSYSSGAGTFKYYDTKNSCLRSQLSYPLYVAKKLNLGEPTFAACSGAVTDDFYKPNPKNANEPAQLSRLTKDTELVTLTIGGNDAGFGQILQKCVNQPKNSGWGCSNDKELKKNIKQRLAALQGESPVAIDNRPVHALLDVFRSIQEASPKARIYIGGYPQLFGDKADFYTKNKQAPGGAVCFVPVLASVSYSDARWLSGEAKKLNMTIESEVKKARKEGVKITYVPPDLFSGHALCDRSRAWINGVVFGEPKMEDIQPESFHPSAEGYSLGYGLAFEAIMRKK